MSYQWTETYAVHIQALDRQHQGLFRTVNKLGDALSSGNGGQVVDDVLKQLVDYTVSHFAAEEKLMEQHGFPGLADHKLKHQELTRKVLAMQAEYKSGNVGVPVSLMLFLQSWLKEHILVTDKRYSAFLNAKGVH
jgi:hemerythrin